MAFLRVKVIKNSFVLVGVLSTSLPSYSDATGAGDAAIYAEMVKMVKLAREELENVRELTSLQEQLKDMKQSELVKEVSKAGRELGGMFNDIQQMENIVNDIEADPFGTKQIERDIRRIDSRLSGADEKSGMSKARSYTSLMSSLRNISWLGKVVNENKKKIGEGINDSDAKKITASSTLVISDLMTEEIEKKNRSEMVNTIVVDELFEGVSYGNMGLIQRYKPKNKEEKK